MKKGKLLGRGMTAEVYEWGRSKVLKLYYDWFTDDWIRYEARIGDEIHKAGVPSPAFFDIINVNGRTGIVLQRIYGRSMLRHVEVEPWNLNYYAQQLAELHFKMHQYTASMLPSQNERFEFAFKHSSEILGDNEKKISDYLKKLPDGSSVCHGDLHFGNVIISNGNLIAIDWKSAYRGNPLGDVARTCLMLCSPTLPIGNINLINGPYMYAKLMICCTYLNEYMRLAKVSRENISEWILPVAAARLSEKIPGEKKWLIGLINMYFHHYR